MRKEFGIADGKAFDRRALPGGEDFECTIDAKGILHRRRKGGQSNQGLRGSFAVVQCLEALREEDELFRRMIGMGR